MTESLEQSFKLASMLTAVANQKRVLYEEHEQSLFYFHNGGTFKIDKELISFLYVLKSHKNESCVLIDTNKLPIEIENISNFLSIIIDQYVRSSNSYLAEYQKIKNSKTIESILDL